MILNLTQTQIKSDIEIVIVKNKFLQSDKEILELLKFDGSDETSILLESQNKIYVGCDDSKPDNIAIASSIAIRELNSTNFKSATITGDTNLKEVLEGLILGNYTFETYKSTAKKQNDKIINILVPTLDKDTTNIFQDTVDICESVNMTRDFVNTSPEDFYPKIMAKEAEKIAQEHNLKCKILSDKYFQENNMGAILAVGRASRHKSKLIHLSYMPKGEIKKKIVLVGKGLTYDSGGLSLKPSDFMVTMKSDKSGGSAVLGIIDAIAKLKLPFEVHAIVGAVENMIGGDAFKPDDILTAKNGKTIEVRNTDAEGRLVLADCLCYAQDEIDEIDYIMDFATLTGASVVGVGQYTTSIMGNNNELNWKVCQSALKSGELATSLPFNKHLRKTIKSKIADICNIASTRYGGAITAGMFLDEFIKEENKNKWVHCDIAGPAYVEEQWGYNPYGASGACVRMTIEFLKSLDK
jgi:leucyl aminopeptidase